MQGVGANQIWRAPVPVGSGLWNLLRTRSLWFGLILGFGFPIVVSLVLGAALPAIQTWWTSHLVDSKLLLAIANPVASSALVTLMFVMIYKLMPRAHIANDAMSP